MNRYKFIEIYTKDGNIDNAKIFYEDGRVEKVSDLNVLREKINEFARQSGMTVMDLLNDTSKVTERKIINNNKGKEIIAHSEKETEHEKSTEVEETKNAPETKKRKKGNGFLKVTSLGVAAILGLAGIKYLFNRGKSADYRQGSTSINYQTDNNNRELPVAHVLAEDVNIENISGRLVEIVGRINNGESVSTDDIQYAMDEINQLTYLNIPGISNLMNGGNMYGANQSFDFYKLFPSNSYEYRVLKEFCLARNDLGNNAFAQSREYTSNEIDELMQKSIDFIFNGHIDNFHNQKLGFYDLDPIARYFIVTMAEQLLTTNRNYVGIINNQRCNYNALVNEFAEIFSATAENLVNSSVMRR